MDEHVQAAKRRMHVSWNDVREHRLWEAIKAEKERPQANDVPHSHRRWTWAAAAAIVAGIGLVTWLSLSSESNRGPGVRSKATPPSSPKAIVVDAAPQTRISVPASAKTTSLLRFSEGSTAAVFPGGDLSVLQQDSTAIVLSQQSGKVSYRVEPGLSRRFEIKAKGVEIHVVGTMFTVTIDAKDRVQVAVTKGVVEVMATNRKVVIRHGESVKVQGLASRRQTSASPAQTTTPASVPHQVAVGPSASAASIATASPRSGPLSAGRQQATTKTQRPGTKSRSVAEMLHAIDRARRAGRLADAARMLRRLVTVAPTDPRTKTAMFILGEVELARGRNLAAANAYRRFRRRNPNSPLAGDALAAEARARWKAGQRSKARALALQYRRLYPNGTHLRLLGEILH